MAEMHKQHKLAIYCHASELPRVAKQIQIDAASLTPLEQGGTLPLGTSGGCIEVLHTPGHSGGSVCLCAKASADAKPHSLYVGDTIFPGSCGRLDLPDSDKSAMFECVASAARLARLPTLHLHLPWPHDSRYMLGYV